MSDKKPKKLSDIPVVFGRTEKPVPPSAATMLSIDKFFNRELSWLNFNERVLAEAADPTVPPLERLRFAAIVSSNLDEFFMVRVAEVTQQAKLHPATPYPDGLVPPQVLVQIRETVLRQKARQAEVLADILTELRRHRIDIQTEFPLDPVLDQTILSRLPDLSFVFRKASEPLPYLVSERIHIYFRFPGHYAMATLSKREDRLLEIPTSKNKLWYVLLERWLAARAQAVFPDREVLEAFPFKIIRAAGIRYRPDEQETLEEQVYEGATDRTRAKVIRLEVDAPFYSEGALFLANELGLESTALYRFPLPLDLRTLPRIYNVSPNVKLRYPPVRPTIPRPIRKKPTVFAAMRRRDIYLHHPYDSFDVVVRFLEEAAADTAVTQIFHTMYRTSAESPVMEALKKAVRKGKKVTVYVEIRARFDELNNVRWARDLRLAGVKVVNPMGDYKVHSKLTLVIRNEEGLEVPYLHMGTGNYHPETARQYTDLGLLTCDEVLGHEIKAYFDSLTRREKPAGLAEILVAPGNLQKQILRLIEEEIAFHQQGRSGHIVAKMNALVDPDIIEALYTASRAGVKIDLLVRGICCLRPGLAGLSETIQVTSIVDRFLEHSRIYYFRSGGAERLYLSSADWMPRNFYQRYEIAFPVKDARIKKVIWEVILKNGLSDNTKAWVLKPDGTYVRRTPGSARPIRSQFLFEELARKAEREILSKPFPKPR